MNSKHKETFHNDNVWEPLIHVVGLKCIYVLGVFILFSYSELHMKMTFLSHDATKTMGEINLLFFGTRVFMH